ncbi:MAG: hypothetical protein ACYC91_16060 [Solirubrobacteraceae bacterium]
MPRPRRLLIVLALPWLGIGPAGCGNTRDRVPNLARPAPPAGFHALGYPRAGVTLLAPRNWTVLPERSPLIAVIASGEAVTALWRFPRSIAPPADPAALRLADAALLAAARARDRGLQLIRSAAVEIDRAPALELDAIERINGRIRRVRSTHVFLAGAELVLEQYAPVSMFHMIDHAVFSPMKRSLRLLAPGSG